MDALSDILRVARLSGGVFFNAEFSAPWCIAARMAPEFCTPFLGAADHLIPYHYVVDGEMQVALPDRRPNDSAAAKSCSFPAMSST
jgi:AraC family transcriptional regulator, alkane utilization regulator